MQSLIFSFYKKIPSPRSFILIGFFILLMIFIILPEAEQSLKMWSKGIGSLEFEFSFSLSELYGTLFQLGKEGRDTYLFLLFSAYLLFPILYGLFFTMLLQSLFQNIKFNHKSYWILLPIFMVFLDISDNFLMSFIIWQYPIQWSFTARVLSFLSIIKWSFLIFFSFGVLIGIYLRLKIFVKHLVQKIL